MMTNDELYGSGAGCSAVLSYDAAVDRGRRWSLRAGLAAGASLLAVVGLGFAAGAAQATTFPGTNGRIAASGALNLESTNSRLELFTMNWTYDADQPFNATTNNHDECQLTDNEDSDFNPRYSHDGTKIVFVRNGDLWTMQLDSNGKAPDPPGTCSQAGPSATVPPYPAANQPGNQVQLTDTDDPVTGDVVGDGKISFVGGWCKNSSNEEWIVYQQNDGAGQSFNIYKQKMNGLNKDGSPVQLTNNAANDSQPSVRPDCSAVAFHSNRAGTVAAYNTAANSDVWTMDFSGGSLTNRTDCSQVQESAPSWSPGTAANRGGTGGTPAYYRLLFQSPRDTLSGEAANFEIYRMDDVDSSIVDGCGDNTTRLSHSPASGGVAATGGAFVDVTGYDVNPSYSPDGTRVCFHSGRANDADHPEWRLTSSPSVIGQWELYHLDAGNGEATGTATVRLTKRMFNDERCGWQRVPDTS